MNENLRDLIKCLKPSDELTKFNDNVTALLKDYEKLTIEVKQKREERKIEQDLLLSTTNILE